MALAKADFYYGALLSQLVNSGFAPAIIDQGEARRVYEIANNTADFKVYAKYVSKPVNTEVENKRWDFSFNEEEIQTVLNDVSMNMFAFVCGIDSLRDSEICFLSKEQLRECFGLDYSSPTRRITVCADKGSRYFTVYGTALERTQNPLKVTRNLDKRLQEFLVIGV